MVVYKVYQEAYDGDTIVGARVKYYSKREEADKALEYLRSLPESPYYSESEGIEIIETEDSFSPWFSDKDIAFMKEEQKQYEQYLEMMKRDSEMLDLALMEANEEENND